MRAGARTSAALVLGSVAALEGCRSAEGAPPAESTNPWRAHGSLASRYRARWTGDEQDHDLTEVLSLEVGDRAVDTTTAYVLAEGLADLDGKPADGGADAFFDLADTYDGAVTGRLFHAYVDWNDLDEIETFRLGRQVVQETPEVVYFDGVRAETAELGDARSRLGIYAGVPVKTYAPSSSGDAILGAFGETRPWKGGRLRLDWMSVEDEGRFGPRADELWGLAASQSVGKSARIDAEYTHLEDDPRDVRARASWYAQESDLVLQASWYRLLETQGDLTVPFDPFYATLFELHPYHQAGLVASKSFGEHFDLQAGFDLRRVDDSADIGVSNRDFDRAFAIAGLPHLLPAEIELSLTGEVWDSPDTEIETFGADLARRFGQAVEAAIGTYYSLFKYDLFQDRELDDVRTWYVKVDWARTERTVLGVRYEFEDDDEDEYHSVRIEATWRF